MSNTDVKTDDGFVLLVDLANEFGIDRSSARKWVIQNGVEFIKVRGGKENGYQPMIAVSNEDAETLRELRGSYGSPHLTPNSEGNGQFYIIQTIPDIFPNRIKFGFTTNVESRLKSYLTITPTASVLQTWYCKPEWERAAIDSISRIGCTPVGVEVFDCGDIDELLKRSDAFFALMPSTDEEESLAKCIEEIPWDVIARGAINE